MVENECTEFKASFDPDNPRECLMLVKEIVAMANAKSGTIFLGKNKDGTAPGVPPTLISRLYAATLADKVDHYIASDSVEVEVDVIEVEDSDAFFPPHPLDLLAVHPPPLTDRHGLGPPIPPAGMLLGKVS